MLKFGIFMLGVAVGAATMLIIKKGSEKMEKKCVIDLEQNIETGTWVATSKDVLGLILMSESKEDLKERVEKVVPELLKLNNSGRLGEHPLIEYCERKILVAAI